MELSINGQRVTTSARTLADLLRELGFEPGDVATAVNREIVRRGERAQRRLAPDDTIEILSPMQGG